MDLEQLAKLNELKNSGVITQEEFEKTKAQIMSGIGSSQNVTASAGGPQTVIYNTNAQQDTNNMNGVSYNGERKSRLVYILLAWFLGAFGVHNFYAGYTGRGVAQLLITLLLGWLIVPLVIVGIWVLVEMCVVKTDAQNRPMTPAGAILWVILIVFILLPVIGVLSIGGIAGYTTAMNRYQATEIIDVANKYGAIVFAKSEVMNSQGYGRMTPSYANTSLTIEEVGLVSDASGNDLTSGASIEVTNIDAYEVVMNITFPDEGICEAASKIIGNNCYGNQMTNVSFPYN